MDPLCFGRKLNTGKRLLYTKNTLTSVSDIQAEDTSLVETSFRGNRSLRTKCPVDPQNISGKIFVGEPTGSQKGIITTSEYFPFDKFRGRVVFSSCIVVFGLGRLRPDHLF